MTNIRHHIIHDTDRDGFGSAAMLAASLDQERCLLYPSAEKNGLALLAQVSPGTGDTIWILDIPTPENWQGSSIPGGIQINWVDHHPVRAMDRPPENVRLYLPVDDRPVTTMHLLVAHGLVPNLTDPMRFIRSLCIPKFETTWTRVIDGLSDGWKTFNGETLSAFLARAALGEEPPTELLHLEQNVVAARDALERLIDRAEVQLFDHAVVVHLPDAQGHALRHFSLRAQERFNRPVSIVVHRNRTIYCGRNTSNGPSFDFLAHFAARGIKAVGHPYVAFVDLPENRMKEETASLLAELKDTYLQHAHLQQVIHWAERIEHDLHDLVRRLDVPVFFRPGASGISMVGLTAERPQRGKSGITNLNKLRENFDEQFLTHCTQTDQGRDTPEKQLQSFLLRSAICASAERWIAPLNEASAKTAMPVKLRFAVDEIPLPYKGGKIVCDILAMRETLTGYVPAVIELKSNREMKRLIEQVTGYAALVDRHLELFRRLFSVLLRENLKLNGPCEKWIVWPMAGTETDPKENELTEHGIRVVGYDRDGEDFRFRVGWRLSSESRQYSPTD